MAFKHHSSLWNYFLYFIRDTVSLIFNLVIKKIIFILGSDGIKIYGSRLRILDLAGIINYNLKDIERTKNILKKLKIYIINYRFKTNLILILILIFVSCSGVLINSICSKRLHVNFFLLLFNKYACALNVQ